MLYFLNLFTPLLPFLSFQSFFLSSFMSCLGFTGGKIFWFGTTQQERQGINAAREVRDEIETSTKLRCSVHCIRRGCVISGRSLCFSHFFSPVSPVLPHGLSCPFLACIWFSTSFWTSYQTLISTSSLTICFPAQTLGPSPWKYHYNLPLLSCFQHCR